MFAEIIASIFTGLLLLKRTGREIKKHWVVVLVIFVSGIFLGRPVWLLESKIIPSFSKQYELYSTYDTYFDDLVEPQRFIEELENGLDMSLDTVNFVGSSSYAITASLSTTPFFMLAGFEVPLLNQRLKHLEKELLSFKSILKNSGSVIDGAERLFSSDLIAAENAVFLESLKSDTALVRESLVGLKNLALDGAKMQKSPGLIGSLTPLNRYWVNSHVTLLEIIEISLFGIETGEDVIKVTAYWTGMHDEFKTSNSDMVSSETLVKVKDGLLQLSDANRNLKTRSNNLQNNELVEKYLSEELKLLKDIVLFLEMFLASGIRVTDEMGVALQEIELDEHNKSAFDYKVLLSAFSERVVEGRYKFMRELDYVEWAFDKVADNDQLFEKYKVLDRVNSIHNSAKHIKDDINLVFLLSPLFSRVLGSEEVKNYLILSHSSDELRASGGFVSGIWLVAVQNGTISDLRYFDVEQVDDISRIHRYPSPPVLLERYMGAWQWYLRDVSWAPEFSDVARDAMNMFTISNDMVVDGVIGINQWALLELVQNKGSLSLGQNQESINSHDLITVLESQTDDKGREYSDQILRAIVNELDGSGSLSDLLIISRSLVKSLNSKEVLINFKNEEIQEVIEDAGWSGNMKRSNQDYIYVVDSNIGWSKSDRNIERTLHYRVDLQDSSNITSSLTVKYVNHSGKSAAPCEPQWIDRGDKYSELKNACNWNLARIFIPNEALVEYHSVMLLPEGSTAVKHMGAVAQSDTFENTEYGEYFRQVSGLIVTDVGETSANSVHYELPSSVVNETNNCYEYSLFLQKQPGVRDRIARIEISIPEDARNIDSNYPLVVNGDQVFIKTRIQSDITINLAYEIGDVDGCKKLLSD